MNIITNSANVVIMASETATPTPPAGGALFTLTGAQLTAFQAIAGPPNGGITFDGTPFAALPFVPPVPFDFSNFDNLDKVLKAFALVVRDYTNALQAGTHTQKTINQMKADFTAKYTSLP